MGASPPKPDKSLEREQARKAAEAKAESDALAQAQAEEEAKRRAGLIGRRSLVSGTDLGYSPSGIGVGP